MLLLQPLGSLVNPKHSSFAGFEAKLIPPPQEPCNRFLLIRRGCQSKLQGNKCHGMTWPTLRSLFSFVSNLVHVKGPDFNGIMTLTLTKSVVHKYLRKSLLFVYEFINPELTAIQMEVIEIHFPEADC